MGKEENQKAGERALLQSEHGETGKQAPRKVCDHSERYKEPKYSKAVTAANFLIRINIPPCFEGFIPLPSEMHRDAGREFR